MPQDEEQKGYKKKKSPPLSNGVTNVNKQNEDRSRSRSEKRKGNKKGTEKGEESMGSLTCKICQCVFCDEDDKLIGSYREYAIAIDGEAGDSLT